MNINLFLLLLCGRSSKEKKKFTVGWNIRDNLLYSFSFDQILIFWIFLFFSVELRKISLSKHHENEFHCEIRVELRRPFISADLSLSRRECVAIPLLPLPNWS
jgi:hypothetical protein